MATPSVYPLPRPGICAKDKTSRRTREQLWAQMSDRQKQVTLLQIECLEKCNKLVSDPEWDLVNEFIAVR